LGDHVLISNVQENRRMKLQSIWYE